MTDHEYVLVRDIQIDKKMAPLIEALWGEFVPTEFCCEEISPGIAHIIFPTTRTALKFVERVRNALNDALPALVFDTELRMCPMPMEAGRWSVEFATDCIDLVTQAWLGEEIEICDCLDCISEMEQCGCEG